MATFFTSDTHFGHANIIKYCKRPFDSVREMNDYLIANWNARVSPQDTVYHLGDFAFGGTAREAYNIAWDLNGTLHFIEGNHDGRARGIHNHRGEAGVDGIRMKRFASYSLMDEIEVEGQRIVLCHYALRTWHHCQRGVWHLFGHSHNLLPPFGKSCDVGVDAWNFAPVSFEELKAFMDARPLGSHEGFPNYTPEQVNA